MEEIKNILNKNLDWYIKAREVYSLVIENSKNSFIKETEFGFEVYINKSVLVAVNKGSIDDYYPMAPRNYLFTFFYSPDKKEFLRGLEFICRKARKMNIYRYVLTLIE